jgi:hypothetical protein
VLTARRNSANTSGTGKLEALAHGFSGSGRNALVALSAGRGIEEVRTAQSADRALRVGEKESVAWRASNCAWSVRQRAQVRPPVDNSFGIWVGWPTPKRGES